MLLQHYKTFKVKITVEKFKDISIPVLFATVVTYTGEK